MDPDLFALALVRRLLLEAGHEFVPELIDGGDQLIGPLEQWIHEPRPELEGRSIARAYAAGAGEEVIRQAVASLLAAEAQETRQGDADANPEAAE